MCEINLPYSSRSEEKEGEEIVQLELDRGRKKTCRAIPKHASTDFELQWKEHIQRIEKPAFSIVPGINKNFPCKSG